MPMSNYSVFLKSTKENIYWFLTGYTQNNSIMCINMEQTGVKERIKEKRRLITENLGNYEKNIDLNVF